LADRNSPTKSAPNVIRSVLAKRTKKGFSSQLQFVSLMLEGHLPASGFLRGPSMKNPFAISLLIASAFIAKAVGDPNAQSGQQRLGGPPPPTAEPNGFDKCRFISFVAPTGGGNTALRIKLTSLHHVNPPYTGGTTIAFTAFEGLSVWVGPPANYV
jgi:hypothetical protein